MVPSNKNLIYRCDEWRRYSAKPFPVRFSDYTTPCLDALVVFSNNVISTCRMKHRKYGNLDGYFTFRCASCKIGATKNYTESIEPDFVIAIGTNQRLDTWGSFSANNGARLYSHVKGLGICL